MVECGTLTIESPFDPGQVGIENCQISPGTVTPDEQTTISWDWVNNNDVGGMVDYEVRINGTVVHTGSRSVSSSPGSSSSVHVRPSDEGIQTGSYTVEVDFSASPATAQASSLRADGGSTRLSRANSCSSCGN